MKNDNIVAKLSWRTKWRIYWCRHDWQPDGMVSPFWSGHGVLVPAKCPKCRLKTLVFSSEFSDWPDDMIDPSFPPPCTWR